MKKLLMLLLALSFQAFAKSTIDSRMKGLEFRSLTVPTYVTMKQPLDAVNDSALISSRLSDLGRVALQWYKAHYISANTGTSYFDKSTGQNAFCRGIGIPDFLFSFSIAIPKHGGTNSKVHTFELLTPVLQGNNCQSGATNVTVSTDAQMDFWTKNKTATPAGSFTDFQATGIPYMTDFSDALSRQAPFTQTELAGIDLSWVAKVDIIPHYMDEQSVQVDSCTTGEDLIAKPNIRATSGATTETSDLTCIDESGTKKMQLDGTSSGGIAPGFSRGFLLADKTIKSTNSYNNHSSNLAVFKTHHSFEIEPSVGMIVEFGPKDLYQTRWTFSNNSGTTELKVESVDRFSPVQLVFTEATVMPFDDVHDTASSKTLTLRERTSNIATLTTSAVHGLSVGDYVNIDAVDATYDRKPAVVLSVPTTTTLTYSSVGADEASTADAGTAIQREPFVHAMINIVQADLLGGQLSKDMKWRQGFGLYLSRVF